MVFTPRERVLSALNHKEPDRIPMLHLGFEQASLEKFLEHIGIREKVEPSGFGVWTNNQVRVMFGVDFRLVNWPFPTEKMISSTLKEDYWGIIWARSEYGDYWHAIDPPLKDARTADDIEQYPKWPKPDKLLKQYPIESARKETKKVYEETDFAVQTSLRQYFPIRYINLRGFTQWIIDMKTNPELYKALTDKIFELHTELAMIVLNGLGDYLDVAWYGDDWGSQTGPFISPMDFRRFVKPWLKNYIETIRRRCPKVKLVMHCDGSIYDLIPELIDCGVQALDPIQPMARNMEPERLKKEFGNKLAFIGGIDIQKIMPFGTTNEVAEHVKRVIRALAPGGGYIVRLKGIRPDIPPENLLTLIKTLKDYGRYPIIS